MANVSYYKKDARFLRLTSYYHKFINGFVGLASPFTCLPSEARFEWTPEVEEAFNYFESDMCAEKIGAIPIKKSLPIAYFNVVLKDQSLALST